jgi:arsenate reductase
MGIREMSDTTAPASVVFVCLHGAAKSVIAAALFDRLAASRGIAARAAFAGTEPDAEIAPAVLAALRQDGTDLRGRRPRTPTPGELDAAARVVAFGCDVTAHTGRPDVEQWADVPAVSADYATAHAAIERRVEALVAEMSP